MLSNRLPWQTGSKRKWKGTYSPFSSDGYIFLASSTTTSSTLSVSASLGGALAPTMNHRSSHQITPLNVWISIYLLPVPSQTLQSSL